MICFWFRVIVCLREVASTHKPFQSSCYFQLPVESVLTTLKGRSMGKMLIPLAIKVFVHTTLCLLLLSINFCLPNPFQSYYLVFHSFNRYVSTCFLLGTMLGPGWCLETAVNKNKALFALKELLCAFQVLVQLTGFFSTASSNTDMLSISQLRFTLLICDFWLLRATDLVPQLGIDS